MRIRGSLGIAFAVSMLIAAALMPHAAPGATFTNVNLGNAVGEPGVALAPNGNVFVNAPHGSGAIWRSTNGGASFSKRSNFDGLSFGSGDTDLSVAPDDGTVYAINFSTINNVDVYVSTNGGTSYGFTTLAGVNIDRPWVTAGRNGLSYVSYHDIAPLGVQHIWVWRSTNRGSTYLPRGNVTIADPVALAEDAMPLCGNIADRVVIDPSDPTGNTIFMTYLVGDAVSCNTTPPWMAELPLNQAWVARSTDGGLTWATTMVAGSILPGGSSLLHLLPNLAADAAGNLYLVYSAVQPGGETHVKMHVSADHGITWQGPFTVDTVPANRSNVFPAVAASSPGRVDVVWYASTAESYQDGGAQWIVADARSTNAASGSPTFVQSQVSNGVVHKDEICTVGLNCIISGGNRRLLDFLDVELDASGVAHVVWANTTLSNNNTVPFYGRG